MSFIRLDLKINGGRLDILSLCSTLHKNSRQNSPQDPSELRPQEPEMEAKVFIASKCCKNSTEFENRFKLLLNACTDQGPDTQNYHSYIAKSGTIRLICHRNISTIWRMVRDSP